MATLKRIFRIDEAWVQNPGQFKKPGWGEPSGNTNKFELGIDIETPSHTKAGVAANLQKARAALNFAVAQKQPESVIKKYEDEVKRYEKLAASVKESSILSFANDKLNVKEGTGLSPATLASYKKKAGEYATAADISAGIMNKAKDPNAAKRWTERANKKYAGITKATKKEFDNDAKGIK